MGTTSGTVDLLGRTISYTDAAGVTTTTSYDVAGRTLTVTSAGGGAVSSTVGYTYRDDGQVDTETLDGSTVASVGYDANAEVSAVTYPFGSVGNLVKYPSGASKGDTWTITQSPTNRTFTEQIKAGVGSCLRQCGARRAR